MKMWERALPDHRRGGGYISIWIIIDYPVILGKGEKGEGGPEQDPAIYLSLSLSQSLSLSFPTYYITPLLYYQLHHMITSQRRQR